MKNVWDSLDRPVIGFQEVHTRKNRITKTSFAFTGQDAFLLFTAYVIGKYLGVFNPPPKDKDRRDGGGGFNPYQGFYTDVQAAALKTPGLAPGGGIVTTTVKSPTGGTSQVSTFNPTPTQSAYLGLVGYSPLYPNKPQAVQQAGLILASRGMIGGL